MQKRTKFLHNKAVGIAKRFHSAESDLIDILQEIDECKAFVELEFGSLYYYAVNGLKPSEANASNFITVARKSKLIPALKEAIRAQEITVSKARKITPVLTEENQDLWITLAKHYPNKNLKKKSLECLCLQSATRPGM